MSAFTYKTCESCGQEVRPTDLHKRHRDRIAALEAKLAVAREALEKMRFIETVHHDDHGFVDLFEQAHNIYLDEALAALGDAQPASAEVKPVAYGVQLLEDGDLIWNTVWDEKWAANDHLNSLLSSGLHEGECHVVPLFTRPTPPQQPRQESEIAAEALEEAAEKLDKWDAQARIVAKWLRERATQKREVGE